MTRKIYKAATYSIDTETAERLDDAAKEHGIGKSEIVRRGIHIAIDRMREERARYSRRGEWF